MTSKSKGTLCDRMSGFLKALGLDNKPDYTDKIPETLGAGDFSVHDTFHHGFPSHPLCLAYDPVQTILAIGTKHGIVVLLGKPGLEGSFKHPATTSVMQMEFIANKGLLITSCDNRTLYQWCLSGKKPQIRHQLEFTKECPTCMSWTYGSEWLYVGNDAGNVHLVHVDNFTLSGYTVYWNAVVDGSHRMRPGDVMAVSEHPMDQGKILIAYSSSLLVLWNIKSKSCDKRYSHDPGINHVLTTVCWLGNGKLFASAYSDGTIAIWSPKVDCKPEKVVPVHESEAGARVSKIIYKLQVQMTESEPWHICSGGYPEESHSCPKTITVRHGKSMTLLSTSSTIVDFISLPSSPFSMEPQRPTALVILTKDELVVHDLQTENFPVFSLPYALDLHMPPVSCLQYHANCPEEFIASLHSVKSKILRSSTKQWPLMGGKWGHESPYLSTDLILTGHTDGSVRLWYCTSVVFQPFFTLPTSTYLKYHYAPFSFPSSDSSSPTKNIPQKSPPSPLSRGLQTPGGYENRQMSPAHTVPPARPPPPKIVKHSSSAVNIRTRSEEVGQETGEGNIRLVQSELQMAVTNGRVVLEGGSEMGGRDEEDGSLESERLKTPSPATGQLRVEGEDGTDVGVMLRTEAASSPGSSRKLVFSREKKSIFKRHSKSKFGGSDSPKLSPKHHHPDNVSDKSDRSESPNPDEKEKEKDKEKLKKKFKSFKKMAIKVKIGRRMMSKGSSSEEKEEADVDSLGLSSEGGEDEREEGGEENVDGERDTVGRDEGGKSGESAILAKKPDLRSGPQRPDTLNTPPMLRKNRGNKSIVSKSFRQSSKRNSTAMTPSDAPKKSHMRSFERRISAPGNFRVSPGTPVTAWKPPGAADAQTDGPLTPIVEISPPMMNAGGNDSVFMTEEEMFAVQGITCCVLGQWLCVSNVGGHVMAFSFQIDEQQTTPKTVDVDFNHDTVLKCGSGPTPSLGKPPPLGWALNERVSETAPGFRLRQHVKCVCGTQRGGGGGGDGVPVSVSAEEDLPISVGAVQYSLHVGLLAVGTNKGLAVIDTENNSVLHVLSSLTSLLYMTNPSKFTRQVNRESTQQSMQPSRPMIQRHSTSWTLPHSTSSVALPNAISPTKRPAVSKTPTGREGQVVGGVSPAYKTFPTKEASPYTVVDCESSVTALEMVQLPLDKQAAPTLTLWVGTASGHTVTYGINIRHMDTISEESQPRGGGGGGRGRGERKGKETKKRTIQLMPTGLISEHKHPIVALQFLNEWGDRQVVPYRMPHTSSMRVDEGRRRSQVKDGASGPAVESSRRENYVVIVDERKIKSYVFPGMTVINKAMAPLENTTLLTSQYFLCQDLPCVLTLTSSNHIMVHSLPGLNQLVVHHFTPLLNSRVMSTFRVSGDGQAVYMSSESEIQRMCVQRDNRLNLPHCLPDFQVAVHDPQPAHKGKMDWLFGSFPAEMDRATMFGESAGRPGMSLAKRDGVSGAGSFHNRTRSPRQSGRAKDWGQGEEERGRLREDCTAGGSGWEGRGRGGAREGRTAEDRKLERKDTRREAAAGGGLAGQMNKNREALERRKKALSELEQKTAQMAGDADDFASLAEKLANKYR